MSQIPAPRVVFGWFSPSKAKYVGTDLYQETHIRKNGEIIKRGRLLVVTDISASPGRFVNNGDEVFVATMFEKDFVKHVDAVGVEEPVA